MTDPAPPASDFWPLLVFVMAAVALTAVMIALSALLGQRHRQRTTGEPYESGMPLTGTARMRFDVKFYLMAMLFVIFDLETVFIVAWAASARQLGWPGYAGIAVFVASLLLTLFYLWRVGALDWGNSEQWCRTRRRPTPP